MPLTAFFGKKITTVDQRQTNSLTLALGPLQTR